MWFRIVAETIEVLRERLLQYWKIRFMSEWNMHDTLSEGEHNNNNKTYPYPVVPNGMGRGGGTVVREPRLTKAGRKQQTG